MDTRIEVDRQVAVDRNASGGLVAEGSHGQDTIPAATGRLSQQGNTSPQSTANQAPANPARLSVDPMRATDRYRLVQPAGEPS